MTHTCTARELASNGCIVFVIDHHDTSNSYVKGPDGKDMFWDNTEHHYCYPWKNELQKIRAREIKNLIDEIQSLSFVKACGFGDSFPPIAFDKLVIGGHSLGGMTAIKVAAEDSRIKFVIGLDPWLLPCHKEIEEGKLFISQPAMYQFTDSFHLFIEQTEHFPSSKC